MLGSISIAVNSLVGPAIVNLPATYQKAGFIPTTFTIIFVCYLSIMTCLNMSNVISKVPGNSNFQRQIEYSEAFRYFAPYWFMFTQVCFFFCVTSLNMAAIVDTAQVVDEFLANFVGKSTALKVYPYPVSFVSWSKADCSIDGPCDPFNLDDGASLLITAGYFFSLLCFLPLGLMDLKENTASQIFSFFITVGVCVQFIFFFLGQGLNFDNLTLWGENWSDLFGIVLFNFTLVTAIPAWLSEKSPHISATKVINDSSFMSSALYILVGAFGALALPHASENMLSSMVTGSFGFWTQLGASVFAFFIIGLGIPLHSVLTRLNLTGSGICSQGMGNFLGVWLPWSLSWMFYKSALTAELLSWGGMLFTSIIAFIAPLLLAVKAAMNVNLDVDSEGHISIPWGPCVNTKRGTVVALYALVALSVISVILSVIGQFVSPHVISG